MPMAPTLQANHDPISEIECWVGASEAISLNYILLLVVGSNDDSGFDLPNHHNYCQARRIMGAFPLSNQSFPHQQ